jgi:hypothetical protein
VVAPPANRNDDKQDCALADKTTDSQGFAPAPVDWTMAARRARRRPVGPRNSTYFRSCSLQSPSGGYWRLFCSHVRRLRSISIAADFCRRLVGPTSAHCDRSRLPENPLPRLWCTELLPPGIIAWGQC